MLCLNQLLWKDERQQATSVLQSVAIYNFFTIIFAICVIKPQVYYNQLRDIQHIARFAVSILGRSVRLSGSTNM